MTVRGIIARTVATDLPIDRRTQGHLEIHNLHNTGRYAADGSTFPYNCLVEDRIVQEQNSRMYVLSIVAAIFLPLTFVTGLLGMNVGGLPGLDNPKGFAV